MKAWLKAEEKTIVIATVLFTFFAIPLVVVGLPGVMVKVVGAEYTLYSGLFCSVMAAAGFALPPVLLQQTAADRFAQIRRIMDSI